MKCTKTRIARCGIALGYQCRRLRGAIWGIPDKTRAQHAFAQWRLADTQQSVRGRSHLGKRWVEGLATAALSGAAAVVLAASAVVPAAAEEHDELKQEMRQLLDRIDPLESKQDWIDAPREVEKGGDMNDLITALLAWTVAHSGYSAPPSPPEVVYQPETVLAAALCPPDSEHCTPRGYYSNGAGTIALDETLRNSKNLRTRALLIHEMVHYLQDLSGRWSEMTCDASVEREREAYQLQARYFIAQGVNRRLLRMPEFSTANCQDERRSGAKFRPTSRTPPRDQCYASTVGRSTCCADSSGGCESPVDDWFTKGMDATNLKDAKALMEELK